MGDAGQEAMVAALRDVSQRKSGGGGALPEGWATAQDAEGTTYYYHTETGETSWDHPGAVRGLG